MASVINMDPKYIGPGVWFSLHLLALNSNTDQSKEYFRNYLGSVIKNFWCHKCRVHATRYVTNNPIEDFDGLTHGYFTYTWKFHNDVNKRLGKKLMDWQTAFDLYTNKLKGVCTHECENVNELQSEIMNNEEKKENENIRFITKL